MKEWKVRALLSPPYGHLWEVSRGGRWWTSTGSGTDAHICNELGRVVSPTGALGRQIRKAIAEQVSK